MNSSCFSVERDPDNRNTKVIVTAISRITNRVHTRKMNMGFDAFLNARDAWYRGAMIQDAFSALSLDDREFLMNGSTPEEWDAMFGEED